MNRPPSPPPDLPAGSDRSDESSSAPRPASSSAEPPSAAGANWQEDAHLFDRPDSPCIGICSTLFDEVCQGCGRTAYEVSNWVFLDEQQKRAIWARITQQGTARRFRR